MYLLYNQLLKPVNENLMELLIFVDALRRASAKTINVIIPYYGYMLNQDRKSKPKRPITSKLVANLLATAGVDRVVTMDLHMLIKFKVSSIYLSGSHQGLHSYDRIFPIKRFVWR